MVVAAKKKKKRDSSRDFVNNARLIEEIKKSKARLRENPDLKAQAMTDDLAKMLQLMVRKYCSKPSFANYTWKEEFEGDALVNLCNKWNKFDETKWDNAFAYYTTIIHRCFLWTLGKEKKHTDIRDNLLESLGLTPSFARQLENESRED